jgi:HK97 family phage prohead protease
MPEGGAVDIKTLPIEVKAGPDDGLAEGEFIVYPSTFTKTPDAYGDIVAPGAFLDTIKEWADSGLQMPILFGHRMDDPDFFVGGAIEMSEDEHGWRVKGAFDMESPKGPQVYRLVKSKRLNQLSFAYDTRDEGQIELEDGTKANELRDLKVYEASFVPVGANQDTSVVAVKALALAIEADVKSGRAISAKNETSLREAAEKISAAAGDIKNVLSALDGENDDQKKASGQATTNDEEPQRAKSEESGVSPSARALAINQFIQTL